MSLNLKAILGVMTVEVTSYQGLSATTLAGLGMPFLRIRVQTMMVYGQ